MLWLNRFANLFPWLDIFLKFVFVFNCFEIKLLYLCSIEPNTLSYRFKKCYIYNMLNIKQYKQKLIRRIISLSQPECEGVCWTAMHSTGEANQVSYWIWCLLVKARDNDRFFPLKIKGRSRCKSSTSQV